MLPNKVDSHDCPSCKTTRECILDQTPSTASYALSFASVFLFGVWSLFIIPLIFQSTKIIVKRCYFCNTEIERQKFFAIPSLSDQVLQFKFGSCVIVLSRKYAVVLLAFFIILFCYFEIYIVEPTIPEVVAEPIRIVTPWVTFLDLCGKYQIMDNGLRAKVHFDNEFFNKQISWDGYIVSTKRNYDPLALYSELIFVKMSPTESLDDFPDIVLGVPSKFIGRLSNEPRGMNIVNLEGTVTQLGNEYNYHIVELHSYQVIDEIIDIETIPKYQERDLDDEKDIPQTKPDVSIEEESVSVSTSTEPTTQDEQPSQDGQGN